MLLWKVFWLQTVKQPASCQKILFTADTSYCGEPILFFPINIYGLLSKEAKNNGATIVTVDPFQSKTSEESDWHIQPRPGTDTALALGLMHVILAENLQDQEYINNYTLGHSPVRSPSAKI
jgi:anaerobic selenocysteine-containing dehydrogenase